MLIYQPGFAFLLVCEHVVKDTPRLLSIQQQKIHTHVAQKDQEDTMLRPSHTGP